MSANEPKISCPDCGSTIKLTESLAAPMIAAARQEDAAKLRAREALFAEREIAYKHKSAELAAAQADMDTKLATKLKAERVKIQEAEAAKARQAALSEIAAKSREVALLQETIKDKEARLDTAQKAELDYRKKERALADAKRELELTVEKRVQVSLGEVQAKARAEAEAAIGLKVTEKDERIASMSRTIEDLQRKAAQGSQQTQGEALEVHIEATLGRKFPLDIFEPVQKGVSGADLLQRVKTPGGVVCGTILWETKRTKNWNSEWLTKLRNDQRAAKSDIAIIVSTVLPKGVTSFDLIDGVWVVGVAYIEAVAGLLRQGMMDVQAAKIVGQGQQTKTEQVYTYLTGPHFKQRVEAIVENFTSMREDLDRERKAMIRLWAKREKQIDGVIDSTVGMYGDLQGIAGQAIGEIKGLEFDLPILEEDDKLEEGDTV